jgi:UDP-glucose 4-epimerase
LRSTAIDPVKIFGNDWPTPDGTCIRDYVHVIDLIEAHIKALETLTDNHHEIYNLGSGDGFSVRQIVDAASKATGYAIPTLDSARRDGDPAILIADITKARKHLDWRPTRGIDVMISDTLESIR